jgi:hypothetical protein
MRTDDAGRRLCSATTRKGLPCKGPAIQGGLVCRMHGGAAPQVKEAARRVTLERLVGPALVQLGHLIADPDVSDAVRLGAIRDVLDRTRYGEPIPWPVMEVEIERQIAELKADMTPEELAASDALQARRAAVT